MFYCLVSLQPVAPLPEKFSARFSIIILSFSSRQYVVSMFPALFYFEICVFKEMNQLPSPLWPILQLHSIALSRQLRIALPEQAQESLRGPFAVGQFARPFFPQGAVQWLRKSEERILWRSPKPGVAMSFSRGRRKGFYKV